MNNSFIALENKDTELSAIYDNERDELINIMELLEKEDKKHKY